jgi:hypothetical protein
VRMIQLRDGARLALEPVAEVFPGDFDGDDAIQPSVASFIDFAHPARANGRKNLVRPEALTGGKRHRTDRFIAEGWD